MAGFCGACGKPLGDNDKVCGNCGAMVPGKTPVSVESSSDKMVANKVKSENKGIKFVVIAIVAIVAIVIVSNVISSNFGYNGTIKKMVKAFADYDMSTLQGLASEINNDMYGMRYGDKIDDFYEDRVYDALDDIEERVGTIKSISYEIIDATEYSEQRLDEFKDKLVYAYNMYVDDIKGIVKVDLKLTVKGSKKSASYNVNSLLLIKESGRWKLLYGYPNY